jgi:hypothetical protein
VNLRPLPLRPLALALLALCVPAHAASERQDLLELKNTVLNLVDALVKQGVLDKGAAEALIKKAEADAAKQATEVVAKQGTVEEAPAPPPGQKVVRVPYVPEFVKQEIREQVRSELRQDVLHDVEHKAKEEKWGTPDALPAWVSSIKFYGDLRVRNEFDHFGDRNADTLSPQNLYLDILAINKAGGISKAGTDAFLNTSDDENRWRGRLRFGAAAKLTDRWTADFRLATGNPDDPVSTNFTLGDTGKRFDIQLDRATLNYSQAGDGYWPAVSATFGRMANPWVSTDLVWDEDLNFDGLAVNVREALRLDQFDLGDRNRNAFLTLGLFPIEQVDFSGAEKWMAGGQLGAVWEFDNQTKVQLAAAYYDYIHITGQRNALGSTLKNDTAPDWLQKGNLLFNIANDPNLDGGFNDQRFALASDYNLLDLTASVDLAYLAPYHVVVTGDVVKNLGFDKGDIMERTGGVTYLYPIKDRTLGWQVELLAGWPQITKWGDWQITAGYRYLQRDAVLDAFTDSDFHLGGTDAKGYKLSASYGLARNVWLRGRWLSATEIDGPPLSIDVLQVDLNARF